jgi:hypothetical protein
MSYDSVLKGRSTAVLKDRQRWLISIIEPLEVEMFAFHKNKASILDNFSASKTQKIAGTRAQIVAINNILMSRGV